MNDIGDVIVSIDENKFRQVIVNLVTNAFKFTPKDGRVVVSVSYVKDCKEVKIEVTDTGAGIDPVSHHQHQHVHEHNHDSRIYILYLYRRRISVSSSKV